MCRHVGRHCIIYCIVVGIFSKKIKKYVTGTVHCHGQALGEGKNTHCFLNLGHFAIHGDMNSM